MSSKGEQPGPAFVVILALTQIVAWGGTYYPVSVLSKEIAAGLHVKAAVVTAAPTVLLLGTALASLPAARLLGTHGPRRVMALATAMGAAGLAVVATGPGWEWYLAGWAVAGLAGAAMLTLGAQVAIATFRPAMAPRDLRLIMLATCLAPTIFWPVTDLLSGLGWRGVFGVNGGLLAVASAALWIVLPAGHGRDRQTAEATSAERLPRRPLMALIGGVSLNGFVSSGLPLVFIPLFVAAGLDRGLAVGIAAALGAIQAGARALTLVAHLPARVEILAATVVMIAGTAVLFAVPAGGAAYGIGAVALFGLGSGVLAVARATLPYTLFDPAAYTRISGLIALPLNLVYALSPAVFAALLTASSDLAVSLAVVLSVVALGCLAALPRTSTSQRTGVAETG